MHPDKANSKKIGREVMELKCQSCKHLEELVSGWWCRKLKRQIPNYQSLMLHGEDCRRYEKGEK